MGELMAPRSPRLARTLPAQILTALTAQSLVVPGTAAFAPVISSIAGRLRDVHDERADLAAELEARLEAHPLGPVLTSMPGLGVRTAIKLLTIVGDGSAFPTGAHLAAYAGLAPVTRRSGSSIKGETRSQRGNHALKSALFHGSEESHEHRPGARGRAARFGGVLGHGCSSGGTGVLGRGRPPWCSSAPRERAEATIDAVVAARNTLGSPVREVHLSMRAGPAAIVLEALSARALLVVGHRGRSAGEAA